MNRYATRLLALLSLLPVFLFPAVAFATSSTLSFSPTSPQTYDGTSDIFLTQTGGNGAGFSFEVFKPSGAQVTRIDFGDGSHQWAGYWTAGAFQTNMGAAGTVNFVSINTNGGTYVADCETGASAYTTCTNNSLSWLAGDRTKDITYVLSGAASGPPSFGTLWAQWWW